MRGADTLYNTYWIDSNYGADAFAGAVRRSQQLFAAAREAGIRRLVHISIANPTASDHPYYASKAALEEALQSTGLSYGIVRPTLVYGEGDVLINNIAWVLRHFPIFAIPGDGAYRLQPVHVDDVAAIAVAAGLTRDNLTVDAAGPDILRFDELVRMLRQVVESRAVVLKTAPALALAGARVAGFIRRGRHPHPGAAGRSAGRAPDLPQATSRRHPVHRVAAAAAGVPRSSVRVGENPPPAEACRH